MKYSKEQLQSAIGYWTRRLNALNESKLKIIDDLIKAFGEDVVLSKEKEFSPTTSELKTIFGILNAGLFNNELKAIPVTRCTARNIADRLNVYNAVSNNDEPNVDDVSAYGMHLAATKAYEDPDGKLVGFDIFNNIIMLNSTYFKENVFIFVVACVCHEMIHYCDCFSDEFRDKFIKFSNDEISEFDSHKDSVFKDKMIDANNVGIHVTEKISPPAENAPYEARITLKNVFGENEKFQDVVVHETPGMLIISNKRTKLGVLAQYD